jgi:hypothetical protein
VGSSDFIEAAAHRNEASGNAQRFNRAMLLNRGHTGSVRLDAAGNPEPLNTVAPWMC